MQHSCSHANAISNHSFKKRIELRTQEQPLVAKHIEETNRVRNDRRLQPLYAEKHKVSCSGFLPKTLPMQHSCGHSNAICIHSFKKRIELRTQEQPLVAKHIEGTKRPQPQPPHTRNLSSPAARKNTRFRAPASSPKHSPCNIMQPSCSHSNAICNRRFQNTLKTHTQAHPKQLQATVTLRQKKR